MSEKEEFSKLISFKECPICSRELDKGYIIPAGRICWDIEKHQFSNFLLEDIVPRPIWTLKNVPALRCKQCEIVIFDYEKCVCSETPEYFLKQCVKCGKEIPIAALQCQYCGSEQEPKHKEDEQAEPRHKPRQAHMIR